MELRIEEIFRLAGGKILHPAPSSVFDTCIAGVSTDTRKLKKGELFIALEGDTFDGGDFVKDAFKKGAVGAIVAKTTDHRPQTKDQFIVQVADTLKALGDIAAYYRAKFDIPLIAITGSCGKTMTKEITSAMLSSEFEVLKTLHNYNNLIGVPLTLFNLTPRHEAVVVEMGMSRSGEIKELARMAQPDAAVITNVGKAHVGFFKSYKEIAKAKAELLRAPSLECCILNCDDEFFPYFLSKARGRVITFGLSEESDFCAERIVFDAFGRASFLLNGKIEVKLPFLGRGNIYNTLASLAVSSYMGIKPEKALSNLSGVEIPLGRTFFYESGGFYVLDDTYNANPSSFLNLLETVDKINVEGRKILVIGDMLELGKDTQKEHIEAGRLASRSSVNIVIAVGKSTKFTVEALSGNRKVWHFSRHDAAKRKLENLLDKGDLVIFKGSRAMSMEKIILSGLDRKLAH